MRKSLYVCIMKYNYFKFSKKHCCEGPCSYLSCSFGLEYQILCVCSNPLKLLIQCFEYYLLLQMLGMCCCFGATSPWSNPDISCFENSEDPDDQDPHFPICLLIKADWKMWINWIKTG